MRSELWTPEQGLPDGARAQEYLRRERRRARDRWRHVRDPRVERTIQCAIAVDGTGVDYGFVNTSSRTVAFTVTTANKLVVGVGMDGGDTITAITYSGVSLFANLVVKVVDASSGYTYMFWLDGPAAGTNNIIVTSSVADNMRISAVAYSGMASGAPTPFGSDGTTGGAPRFALTPAAANSWIVGYAMEHSGGSPTITDAFITNYRSGVTYNAMADTGVIAGTPSTFVGFSGGGNFGMVAASFAPDLGGGGGAPPPSPAFGRKMYGWFPTERV